MSQRGGSPVRSNPSEKRKTSPNSGSGEGSRASKQSKPAPGTSFTPDSGREGSSRVDRGRMPSQSPQESRGHPVDRMHGPGKGGPKSVSPANGVDSRGEQRRGVDRAGEQYREAKHHRREADRRHERDGSSQRVRRDSREPERRRGSESGREAGEIPDDRLDRGEYKRQKTEHRPRSRPRENGRDGAAGSKLPLPAKGSLPPKGRSPDTSRLAMMPEAIRQAALDALANRQAAEKAARESQEKVAGAKASPAPASSKPLSTAERLNEEAASFLRSQAEAGNGASDTKASPSGSVSENGEIRGTPRDQADPGEQLSDLNVKGDVAVPTMARSRWEEGEDSEEDGVPNGKGGKEDNMPALGQELVQAQQRMSEQEADAEQEKLSLFQQTRAPINMLNSARKVECFERLNTISEGTYGVVHRAKDKATGTICALKKIKMDREKEGFPITSIREINILLNFHHRNLVDVSEVVVGDSLDDIFMVMEFMEHDLKGLMEAKSEPFSVAQTKNLMHQLLTGMAYLHENWVLHRDLKTSNILYNNEGQLKICDFGMARQYGSPLRSYTPTVVTQYYRSIELLLGEEKYSTAVDMWSLGCIMAELLTKKVLFPGTGELDQITKIFKVMGSPNERVWPGYKNLKNVRKLNIVEERRTIRDVLPKATRRGGIDYDANSGLSEAGFDLIEKLLALDPKQRISAEEALKHKWFQEQPKATEDVMMPTFPAHKTGNARQKQLAR